MLILFLLISSVQSSVISVVEVFRHGARAPTDQYTWDTGTWNQGLGELTPSGMRQHYLNGQEFRNRYATIQDLLSPQYMSEQIYVRSTDVNRTIMSAQSQLLGFFPQGPSIKTANLQDLAQPPFNVSGFSTVKKNLGSNALPNSYQPIPIEIISSKYDHMLAGWGVSCCPKFNLIIEEVRNSADYKQREANYNANLKQRVFQILGQNVSMEDAGWMADPMFCELFEGYQLPNGVDYDMFQELFAIFNYSNSYFYNQEGASLASSQFFEALISQFNQTIDKTGTIKIGFYSGHDTTLIGFLIFLGIWDGHNPPFASSLIFELHSENDQNLVKIIYNDEVKTLGGCQAMCPFENFISLIEPYLISNVPSACQIPDQSVNFLSGISKLT